MTHWSKNKEYAPYLIQDEPEKETALHLDIFCGDTIDPSTFTPPEIANYIYARMNEKAFDKDQIWLRLGKLHANKLWPLRKFFKKIVRFGPFGDWYISGPLNPWPIPVKTKLRKRSKRGRR